MSPYPTGLSALGGHGPAVPFGNSANLPKYHPWRDLIQFQEDVDSTNTRLKLSASQGAPHGSVLIADHQTGGRGRRGRSFASPPNMGIYLSALLRPQCRPEELMHLTCAVAEAMVQGH